MHTSQREPDPAANGPQPGRSRMRRALRGLGLLALSAIVLIALVVIALDLGWQRDRIVGIAEAIFEERLGVDVSIGRASGRLSRGIELEDVRVGEAGDPFARADSIELRWRLRSLVLGERWVADRVHVEGWSVRLRRTADGRWSPLEDLLGRLEGLEDTHPDGSDSDAIRPDLLVRRIEIAEGELELVVEPGARSRIAAGAAGDARDLRASWRVEGQIRGLRAGPQEPISLARARLEARLGAIDSGFPDFDREARAHLDLAIVGTHIDELSAEATAPGLEARLRGSGRLDHLDRLHLELEARDLAPLGGWVQATDGLEGRLEVQAELAGPPSALTGQVGIVASALRIGTLRAQDLDLDLEIEEPIRDLPIDPMRTKAKLRLRARGLDPGTFAPDWLPPGAAEIDLEGAVRKGRLQLSRGSARLAGLAVEAEGSGSREHIESLDLRFELEDVAPWLQALDVAAPLSGGLTGEARIEGPVGRPVGRVRVHSDSLLSAGRFLGPFELSLDREPDRPLATVLRWGAADDLQLAAQAEVDLGQERIDFELAGEAEAWTHLLTAAFGALPSIEGDVEATGFVARSSGGPRFGLQLRSQETIVAGESLGRVELVAARSRADGVEISKLTVSGRALSLALLEPTTIGLGSGGAWQTGPALLSIGLGSEESERGPEASPQPPESAAQPGTLVLEAQGRGAAMTGLETTAQSLPVALADHFLPELLPDVLSEQEPALGGRLSGTLSWRQARDPGWTVAELEWVEPRFAGLRWDRIAARWTATGPSVDLELRTWRADGSPLVIEGRLEVPDREAGLAELVAFERLSLQATFDDWDLAKLQIVAPGWMRRIAGQVNGTLQVERGPSGLRLDGQARLTSGGVTVPLLRQRFAPIEGRFRLANRVLSIDSLRVGEGEEEGIATLVGAIRFPARESPQIEGEMRFERFPLARASVASMNVLGGVRLDGSLARPVIRGELALEDARIGVPAADDPILREIRIATRSDNGALVETPAEEAGLFDAAEIDVGFSVPGSTRVLGQGANLFVEGEARVEKLSGEPVRIRGEARVVNGTYTFQGRRFQVRRGRVLLTGGTQLDPVLDVEARLPVKDIVAIVHVSGRLSSPIVRLDSEPARSEQDVLAYLIFGRPADQVGAAGGTRFETAAAQLVAGVAERELRDVFGDAMPVDTIEIGADEEGQTSELGFGKYLSRNIFFRYVHVLGEEPADQVGVEYRLNDAFSIGSSISTTGDAGLDLILRHDF